MTTPSDDRELLISAYLDDDLDASERALVEADADLLATVEATANVRALLAERAPIDRARRESVLAAALAAFDARALDATSPDAAAASTVGSVERQFASARAGAGRHRRWLAPVAAAAVAVVGLGVFAATVTDDDDDETSDDAASVLSESAATEAASATELMAEAEVASDDAAPASGATMAAPAADTGGVERTATIASPEQLAAFAAELTGAATEPAGDSPQVCGRDVIGLATYVETGAAPAIAVAVYVDEAAGEVVAVDTSTCAVVLRAPAP